MTSSPVPSVAPWRLKLRSQQARASRSLGAASYTRKWLILGVLVGVIAGLGAVVFYEALQLADYFFLQLLAGYTVPSPFGEGAHLASAHFVRPWAVPLVTSIGALAGAILVFRIAPDAEGHGTDAAIAAVHHNPRGIRLRTVFVKIVASALTIGSGGSGGREGPTGQISAGFGSFLARFLDLSPADARIVVASGIGSGIGSIFGAPLGGAVLATEIMYRDDFEVEALLPSFIASAVGYTVWGSVEGFGPLFGFVGNYQLTNASQLVWFGLIGILGGLFGLAYAKGFYGIAALFKRLPLPRWLRPALGGLLVGLTALVIPQVLGTGYGWIQQSLSEQLLHIPLWIVLILPLARIVTTGLSIGSGGSGGIFGPGMVIGAFVGAAVWRLLEPVVPSLGHDPAPYVVVGMMACFGSISRAPLAVMLMVSEMTGTLSLIVPAMVAVGLATLIVRRNDDTIYRSQPRSRADSTANRILTGMPLLTTILAEQAMSPPRCVLEVHLSVRDARQRMKRSGITEAPVIDAAQRFVGVVSAAPLAAAPASTPISSLVATDCASVHQGAHLNVVLDTLTAAPQTWVAVVDDQRRVIGTIAISDMVRSYRRQLLVSLRQVGDLSEQSSIAEEVVAPDSAIAGRTLRTAQLPSGILITVIEREREVLSPSGDTIISAGDRLMVLGSLAALTVLHDLVSPHS